MLPRVASILVVLSLAGCDLKPRPKGEPAPAGTNPTTNPGGPAPVTVPVKGPDAGMVAAAPVVLDAAGPTPPTAPAAPAAPAPADAGAPARPAVEPSAVCLQVSDKIAGVLIGATTDPAQRAALEQDRSKLVRNMADACTRDSWPEPARNCFLAATTAEQIQTCGSQLTPPG